MAIGGISRTASMPIMPASTAAGSANGTLPIATAGSGVPAWNESWHQKFVDAGAPADLLQQLMITGAMGADEATLQSALNDLTKAVNLELAKFRDAHPHEYEKLAKTPAIDRATLLQIATASNSGQLSKKQLDGVMEQVSSPGMNIKTMVMGFLPWTFIPGWGAIRFALSPLFGGKDPFSGEKIHLDFWRHGFGGWMDAAFAVGGVFSLANTFRGVQMLSKGTSAIRSASADSLVGKVIANESAATGRSVAELTGWKKFLPGSTANKIVTGAAHLTDLEHGVSLLPQGSVARQALENELGMLSRGEISIHSKAGWGIMPFGLGSDVRGALPVMGHRNKPMTAWANEYGRTVLNLDGRIGGGNSLVAHAAAAGVNLLPGAGTMSATELQALRTATLAEAGTALGITKSTNPLRNFIGMMRPGATEDVLKAIAGPSVASKALSNPFVKFGMIGLGVAGAGFFAKKIFSPGAPQTAGAQDQPAQDAAAGAQQAVGAAAQQQMPANATQQVQTGQLTAEQQQIVQNFLALSPADQQALLQQAQSEIQAAAQQPNLTEQQQADIIAQAQILDLLVQVAGQGAAVTGGDAAANGQTVAGPQFNATALPGWNGQDAAAQGAMAVSGMGA